MATLKTLLKQPYWVMTLIFGVLLVSLPIVSLDRDHYYWTAHRPDPWILVVVGIGLLLVSAAAFWFSLPSNKAVGEDVVQGLDPSRVKEHNGTLWTTVSECEIRVVTGRLEECEFEPGTVIVLPCNEYFDDECVGDTKTALGAYINKTFEGQVEAFTSVVSDECRRRFGPGNEYQKTDEIRARSFGPGKCLLLPQPLNRSTPLALISTTTQRAGQGLASRISYLFDGMRELVARAADARFTQVAMPVLGAGHGHINKPLALVGLLLGIAEAARYGQGGQRLRRVTIVVFKANGEKAPEIDPVVIRRALALIGSESR